MNRVDNQGMKRDPEGFKYLSFCGNVYCCMYEERSTTFFFFHLLKL